MIIGLCGAMRSGKDTVASALVARGWTRVGFADALRVELLDVDPIVAPACPGGSPSPLTSVLADNGGWEGVKQSKAWADPVRGLLQDYGMRVRAERGDDYWVGRAFAALADIEGDVVVSDVRMPNEVSAIRDRGGKVIRVVRPDLAPNDSPRGLHISETALIGVEMDAVFSSTPMASVGERLSQLVAILRAHTPELGVG